MPNLRNFGDIFPPRNLGEGENWGSHVQTRIEGLEAEVMGVRQLMSNDGRVLNARADIQADQIVQIFQQQEELQNQQASLQAQQQDLAAQQLALEYQNQTILSLVNSMPRNDGSQVRQTGWSVDSAPATGAWTTVASASLTTPENMNRVAVTAWGNASAASSNVYESAMQARILVSSTGSPVVEGTMEILASTVRTTVNVAFFREFQPGGSVSVSLQVRGRYSDFPSSNVANLTVSAGFTRVGL